jgi:hypothetical protein
VRGAGALAALAFVVFFGLGMHRGLLLSSDIKSRCWPWAGVRPPLPLQAPALSDPVWQFVPWLRLAREEILHGRLPLWNPHQDGGEPLLGNAISALGSPLYWPPLLLGIDPGWNLSLLLRIVVAFAAAFLWLRDLGRSALAAALGAVAFALSGSFVAWLEHPQTLVAAGVPLLLLFARRVTRHSGPREVTALAGSTLLVLSGGHPETQLMAALLAAAVVIRETLASRRFDAWLPPVGAALLGLGLAAPLLLPFAEYFRESAARLGLGRSPFTLPARDLLRFVLPSVLGSNAIEAAASVSIVLLGLVPIGLALRHDGETRFWAAAAGVMLLATYANPVSRALAFATPVHWTRLLLFVPLGLGVVASSGLDALRKRVAARRGTRQATALSACLLLLAFAELTLRARGVHAVTSAAQIAPATPLLDRLRADPGLFRILPLHTFLPPNSATDYGLDDVRGYDALDPAGWLVARRPMGRFGPTPTTTEGIEPGDLEMGGAALDFWNVRYLLLDPRFTFPVEEWNARRRLDLEEIYSGPDGRILRNRRELARGRLSVAGSVTLRERRATLWDFDIDAALPGVFTLANPFFPGWRARVDGRDAHLDLSPGAPIALAVPAGRHRIRIDYRPRSFLLGVAAMIIAALALLALRLRPGAALAGAR